MPAGNQDPTVHYVTIDDFRPGIHSKMQKAATAGTAVPAPLGAAQVSGTFKCIALPSGGLAPLPKMSSTFNITLPDTDVNATLGYFNIDGFFAFGPLGPPAASPSGIVDNLFIGVEYLKTGGTNRVFTYYRIDLISATPTVDTLVTVTSTQNPTSEQYMGMSFGVTRMSNTGPNFTNPGNPEVVTSWAPPGFAADQHVWAFPSPAAPATSVVVDLASGRAAGGGRTNVGDIVCHQGRVVMLEYGTYSFGANSGDSIPTNEQISFSDPANSYNTTSTIGVQQSVFMQEFPNGYGAFGSNSASELVLIKHQGGAASVYGDLNTPTVYRYPGVKSTGGLGTRAANQGGGLIYYSRFDGAYLWPGGASSQRISDQLEDDFIWYTPGPDKLLDMHLQFERWGEWVVCSNGYLYDTRPQQQGWWRLDDPTVYTPHWYARGFYGNDLYAVPLRATNAAGPGSKTGFVRHYGMTTPATSYSWQSQPIPASQDRIIQTRDLVLLAQGTGTVAVTLTALDGTTSTETFTVANNSQPQRLRPDTSVAGGTGVQAYNVVALIVSTGTGGNPAPIVHSLAIGVRQSNRAVSS